MNELTVIAYYGLNANGFDMVAIKENHVLRMFYEGEISADPLVRQADAQALLDAKNTKIAALTAERDNALALWTVAHAERSAEMMRGAEQEVEIAALRKAGRMALNALMLTPCNAKHEQDCNVCNAIEAIAQAVQP